MLRRFTPRHSRCNEGLQASVLSATFACIVAVLLAVSLMPTSALATTDSATGRDVSDLGTKTDEITQSDPGEGTQQNYTAAAGNNKDEYLYKSAKWTNQETGEAEIKLVMKDSVNTKSRAVYACATCTSHSFSAKLAKEDIEWLKTQYDIVDVVIVNGPSPSSDIFIKKDVQEVGEVSRKGQKEQVSIDGTQVYFDTYHHWQANIYAGLYKYFYGSFTSTTQVMSPDCIYVCVDNLIQNQWSDAYSNITRSLTLNTASDGAGTWYGKAGTTGSGGIGTGLGIALVDYDYDMWELLKEYRKNGAYVSATSSKSQGGRLVESQYYPMLTVDARYRGKDGLETFWEWWKSDQSDKVNMTLYTNTLVGLIDPELFPGIDAEYIYMEKIQAANDGKPTYTAVKSGKTFPQRYSYDIRGDYLYDEDFSEQDVVVKEKTLIEDTVSSDFEIVDVSCDYKDASVTTENSNVAVTAKNYDGSEVVATIKVKLTDEALTRYNEDNAWYTTNVGSARSPISGLETATPELGIAEVPTATERVVTRTIRYRYESADGKQVANDVVQSYTFTGKQYKNGSIVWDADSATLAEVQSPIIDGWTPNMASIAAVEVSPDSTNAVLDVVYTQVPSDSSDSNTKLAATGDPTAPLAAAALALAGAALAIAAFATRKHQVK